jgi:hypothetical protein
MPKYRKTDPVTSRLAAESVTEETITATQKAILLKLESPMTDAELIYRLRVDMEMNEQPYVSESGIRSRRAELVEKGLVHDTGVRTKMMPSGRFAIVWVKS